MLRVTGGDLRGRLLHAPKTARVRPTSAKVRQALFDILQDRVAGASVLDGFAGSGAVGIEALSRGALRATFVEADHAALAALRRNVQDLDLGSRSEIFPMRLDTALAALARRPGSLDLAFLDPPYDLDPTPVLQRLHECGVMAEQGIVVLETSARRPLPFLAGATRHRYGDTVLVVLQWQGA